MKIKKIKKCKIKTLFIKLFLFFLLCFMSFISVFVYIDYKNYEKDIVYTTFENNEKEYLDFLEVQRWYGENYYKKMDVETASQRYLEQYNDYYLIENSQHDIIYENYISQHFSDTPYMIVTSQNYTQKIYVDLSHVDPLVINEIDQYFVDDFSLSDETVAHFLGQSCSIQIDHEEEKSTLTMNIPEYLSISDKTYVGNALEVPLRAYDVQVLYYQSSQVEYTNQKYLQTETRLLQRNVIMKQCQSLISHTYNQIYTEKEGIYQYKKSGNDLYILQQIKLNNSSHYTIGYINHVNVYFNYFNKSLMDQFINHIGLYILSIVFAFGVSYLFERMISRRIYVINQGIKAIDNNCFDIILEEHTHDEFGILSHNINLMSHKMKKTIEQLSAEVENVKKLESVRKEFIANFTHEIKTPLGIINGYIELIEETNDSMKKEQYLKAIEEECQRINELVLGMLKLSRLESGKVELKRENRDMEDIVSSTIDSFTSLLAQKRIQIIMEAESITLSVDPFEIQIVIQNFLSNAIKNTPQFGHIYIKYQDNKIYIENEGSHISQSQMSSIWDTYVSGDREGTGLGLAICKTILDLHAFHYGVENTEKGVQFWFGE